MKSKNRVSISSKNEFPHNATRETTDASHSEVYEIQQSATSETTDTSHSEVIPDILKKELEERYYEIRKKIYGKALQSGFIYSWEDICHDVIEHILEKGIPPTKWDSVIMSVLDKWKKKRERSKEVSLPNYLRKVIE